MNHFFSSFIKRFLSNYLPIVRGLSVNTIAAYRDSIKLLLRFVSNKLSKSIDVLVVEDITEALVVDFLEHLEKTRNCSATTRNCRLAAISSLFKFIARAEPILVEQCRQIRTIPIKRCEHKVVGYLEEAEIRSVLDNIDINSRTGVRDYALLQLLYNTGARVSEIVHLKLDDLQLDCGCPQIKLFGKGKKERTCPLWPETVKLLKDYLQSRKPVDAQATNVFLNANGYPITRFGIRYVTRKWGAKAQPFNIAVKKLNPHVLRHTCVMHLLHSGNDINVVSFWMGHADINTTRGYSKLDQQMKREMLEKAGAPQVDSKTLWQEPDMLQWLEQLTRTPELCAVKRE